MQVTPIRRCSPVLALLLGLCLAVSGCSASVPTASQNDERLVYCLDLTRQANLATAAVRLGLGSVGKAPDHLVVSDEDLSVEQWQRKQGAQFDRACDALMAENNHPVPKAGGLPNWINDLLSTIRAVLLLLAGAAFTLAAGGLRAAGERRRLQAAGLRGAADNFVAACEIYLDDRLARHRPSPSDQPLRDRRLELAAKLREAGALYPKRVDPQPSLELLSGVLSESIQRDWELKEEPENRVRADGIRKSIVKLIDSTGDINRKLERSVLAHLGGAK
jgi:hypothetical protein